MADEDYDLYDVLNIQRGATSDEVRVAFHDLSRVYHPDKQASRGSGEGVAFTRVHRAYRILSDDVLRGFYDRYGLSGIKLAEQSHDTEGDEGGAVVPLDDKLSALERSVRRLLQRHEELRTQRLLGLQGSFTISMAAGPGIYGSVLRRKYHLQYSAASQTVQINPFEGLKLMIGCASHVQGANGGGAAKLMTSASGYLGQGTHLRAAVNVSGSSPEAEVSLARVMSPTLTVQQKVSVSNDGSAMALTLTSWLSKSLRGSLTCSFGEESSVSLGLVKRSTTSGHSARMFLNFEPGEGELGLQLKYKPVKGFSLQLAPALSMQGPVIQATCTSLVGDDGLSKLSWALKVRPYGATLRLTFSRCGLRFGLPIEVWSESAGPLPAADLGLALALWAVPPFAFQVLRQTALALHAVLFPKAAGKAAGIPEGEQSAAAEEQAAREYRLAIQREASRRKAAEEADRGLVILDAKYGDPVQACRVGPAGPLCIDVTSCLMAKIRHSQLRISDAPKSTLLGFFDPRRRGGLNGGGGEPPALHIRYRFGTHDYERTFSETQPVLLPD